jgi:hypothetical protein
VTRAVTSELHWTLPALPASRTRKTNHARRQKLLEQAELARQEAALHAPATDDYNAGAQPLADYIEGLRQILVREKDKLGLPELPTKQEVQTALRSAEEHAEETRHGLGTARAQTQRPRGNYWPSSDRTGHR